jgi:hypothetical protein
VVLWLGLFIVFTDGRQQRQLNHNTTTYCVNWRTTTTINPIIIRPHIVFTEYVVVLWLGLLLLSSVSKHNMWSYYDWIYCCCCPSVNTICSRIMIELSLLSDDNNKPSHNTTTYCVYWRKTTTINPVIIRQHIVFTDGQQQRQPNRNTTRYYVYWRTTTTINPVIIRQHIVFTDGRQRK